MTTDTTPTDTTQHDLWRSLLADMIRVRVFEERCAELYGESKIRGFLHLYIGEEADFLGFRCNQRYLESIDHLADVTIEDV